MVVRSYLIKCQMLDIIIQNRNFIILQFDFPLFIVIKYIK
jgi:hypothetical protein